MQIGKLIHDFNTLYGISKFLKVDVTNIMKISLLLL
jgi:hypothetical protein